MRMLCSIFVLGVAVLAIFARCASVGAPMGGPRDSLPPRVVLMEPGNRMVNFSGKRVYLEFDEYVVVRGQQQEFFTSPGMATQPTLTLRGRGIQVDIKDTLKADQTYALHFGNAIVDNNEGNPLGDFTFVFSTGATIDSMLMSGWAVDAYTRDSADKAFIYLYPDTIPFASNGDDSTLFQAPAVVARAHSDGLFVAEYLKPINYRVYALQDANGNRTYDPGVDKAGFVDSVWNPATMPGFSIRYDTLMKRLSPDPQLYLRVFSDQNGFRRQLLRPVARPVQRRIDLQFSAPWPIIDTFRLEGIDSTRIIWQSLKPTRDSLYLWLNVADSLLPDTLKGSITYHRHDSANRLVPHMQALSLVWKDLSNLNRDKNDTLPPPNPFKYQVDASQQLNPYNNIGLNFDYPLLRLDTARVSLQLVEYPEGAEGNDSLAVRTPQSFRFEQDSLDMRRWKMLADWVADGRYELMIPAGVFVDMARERNDTLRASFSVLPPEKFASLNLSVVGKDSLSEYIVEITNASGQLLRSFPGVRTGTIVVPYLDPATPVRIRVIEDINGNGRWDGGNLLKRLQPERAELFSTGPEGADIALKENWSYDYTLDMGALFAPVTMESLREQLREIARQRLERILKARAEQQKQPQQNPNQSQGMGFGGIGTNPMPMPR